MNRKIVTVFGSSQPTPPDPDYDVAYELGRALARAGWTLCNGGYGGTMEAAARGAVEAGGHTIGVTLASFSARRGGANPYIRQEVPTFDLLSRLNTLLRLGRAYVALPGGTGTLLELAAAWEMLAKGLLPPRRPLILLGQYWQPVVELASGDRPVELQPLVVGSVSEVIALLLKTWNAQPAPGTAAADPGDVDPP